MKTQIKSHSNIFNLFLCIALAFGLCQTAQAKPGGGKKSTGGNGAKITIHEHPVSVTIFPDDSTSFNVVASVNKGPALQYQWFFNGTAISSATSSTLVIASADNTNTGEYHVRLSSGDRLATSQSATLSLEELSEPTPEPASNSVPVANNDSANTNEDTSVKIDVLANDSDAEGHTLAVTSATALNGTSAINTDGTLLYTPNLDFNGFDTISYTITDSEGAIASASVEVTVIAIEDLRITYQPSSTSINQGESHTLNVSALGEGTLSYQWIKDGFEIVGANQSYLTIDNASETDTGSYEVLVSDSYGSIASNAVLVEVSAIPSIQESSIQLSWNAPEFRDDGTTLTLAEISTYVIYYYQESTDTAKIIEVSGDLTSYNLEGLTSDNYTFWISTVDTNGVEGTQSSEFYLSL